MALGAKSLGSLIVLIGADTKQLDKGIGNAQTQVTMFGKMSTATMQTVGKAALAMGTAILAGMGGVALASARLGMDFEQSITQAAAIAGGGLEEFERVARRVGRETQKTAREAAEALILFSTAGFGVRGSVLALEPAVSLSIATTSDMVTVTELMASSMKAMGAEFEDAAKFAGVFAVAHTQSLATINRLREGMKDAATTGAALGWTIEQTTAAFAQFTDLGLEGSRAGTTLRMSMNTLGRAQEKTLDALDRLGVRFEEVNPQMHDFGDIVTRLAETDLRRLTDANDLFGSRAGAMMLTIIQRAREGKLSYDSLIESFEQGAARLEHMRKVIGDTTKGQWLRFISAVEAAGLAIFDLIKEPLKQLFSAMADLTGAFAQWIEENQQLVLIIALLTAALGTLLVAFGAIVLIAAPVAAAIALIGASTLGLIIIIGGAIAILAALAVAAGAAYIAWKTNFANIQEFTIGTVLETQRWLEVQAMEFIGFWKSIAVAIGAGVSAGVRGAGQAFSAGLNGILGGLRQFAGKMRDVFWNLGIAIQELFAGNFEGAASRARAAWVAAMGGIEAAVAPRVDILGAVTDVFNDIASASSEAATQVQSDTTELIDSANAYYDELTTLVADSIADQEKQATVLDELREKYEQYMEQLALPPVEAPGGGGPGAGADPYKAQREAAQNLLAEIDALNQATVSSEEQKFAEMRGKLEEYYALAQEKQDESIISTKQYNEALRQIDNARVDALIESVDQMTQTQIEKDIELFDIKLELLDQFMESRNEVFMEREAELQEAMAELELERQVRINDSLDQTFDAYNKFYQNLGGTMTTFGNKQLGMTIKQVGAFITAFSKMFVFFGSGEAKRMLIVAKEQTVEMLAALAERDFARAAAHGATAAEAVTAHAKMLGIIAGLPRAQEGAVILAHPNEAVVPFERMPEALRAWLQAGGRAIGEGGGTEVTVNTYVGDVTTGADYSAMIEDIGEAVQVGVGTA
jgi:TP901 family phage tail tape measure protein